MFTRQDIQKLSSYEDITKLHPKDFEWFSKFLLEDLGYNSVFVTEYRADHGIDLKAKYDGEGVLGQCKRWNKGYKGVLPVKELRELGGCMLRDGFKNGVFITTLPFDVTDKREAKKMNIELIGKNEICKYLRSKNSNFASHVTSKHSFHTLSHLSHLFLF
jgi:HJR/Mrr/RecB family endonuclease